MTKTTFHPILMHFAARHAGFTYGAFASDYRALVKSNLKCLEDFSLDAVGLISDPYQGNGCLWCGNFLPGRSGSQLSKAHY